MNTIFKTAAFIIIIVLSSPAVSQETQLNFKLSTQVFEPCRTNKIGLADFDDDGDLDAMFSNMGEFYSRLWLNDGNGKFVDSGQELTRMGHGIGIGDLDSDGDLDLFIPCNGYSDRSGITYNKKSEVYFNDGKGAFLKSSHDIGDGEMSATGVFLSDIDGDNDLDALVSYNRDDNRIYINDGSGAFAFTGLTFPNNPVFGDYNSDGFIDIFEKQQSKGYVTWINDSSGRFNEFASITDTTAVRSYGAAGDVDNDGDLDIVMPNGGRNDPDPTMVFINDGKGNFTDSGQKLYAAKFGRAALYDLNGDTWLDVVILGFNQPGQIWINDGSGKFLFSGIELTGTVFSTGCSFGDLDNDGDIDIFQTEFRGGNNQLWFNTIK